MVQRKNPAKKKGTEKREKPSADKSVSIGYRQSGSYDDDDYYELVFNDTETSAVILHTWHYFRPKGNKQGTEHLTLNELKKEYSEAHAKAVDILKSKGFEPGMLTKSSRSDFDLQN